MAFVLRQNGGHITFIFYSPRMVEDTG